MRELGLFGDIYCSIALMPWTCLDSDMQSVLRCWSPAGAPEFQCGRAEVTSPLRTPSILLHQLVPCASHSPWGLGEHQSSDNHKRCGFKGKVRKQTKFNESTGRNMEKKSSLDGRRERKQKKATVKYYKDKHKGVTLLKKKVISVCKTLR